MNSSADLALYKVFAGLVRALHEEGVLPIETLIQRLETTQDFGRAAFQAQPDPAFEAILENLRAIGAAYKSAQRE